MKPFFVLYCFGIVVTSAFAGPTLKDEQQQDGTLRWLWVFDGEPGSPVTLVEDTQESLVLERLASAEGGPEAKITEGPTGASRALLIPPPQSPVLGGGLRSSKQAAWPLEGTVEFLVRFSPETPIENQTVIGGVTLAGNRFYVRELVSNTGRSLVWWVGDSNSQSRPDLIGEGSPVLFEDGVWYYVALAYRFIPGKAECDLRAHVAAIKSEKPVLQKVAEMTVASVPSVQDQLFESFINLGQEPNGGGFFWQGGLANLAFYNGWLTETDLQKHAATLRK